MDSPSVVHFFINFYLFFLSFFWIVDEKLLHNCYDYVNIILLLFYHIRLCLWRWKSTGFGAETQGRAKPLKNQTLLSLSRPLRFYPRSMSPLWPATHRKKQ